MAKEDLDKKLSDYLKDTTFTNESIELNRNVGRPATIVSEEYAGRPTAPGYEYGIPAGTSPHVYDEKGGVVPIEGVTPAGVPVPVQPPLTPLEELGEARDAGVPGLSPIVNPYTRRTSPEGIREQYEDYLTRNKREYPEGPITTKLNKWGTTATEGEPVDFKTFEKDILERGTRRLGISASTPSFTDENAHNRRMIENRLDNLDRRRTEIQKMLEGKMKKSRRTGFVDELKSIYAAEGDLIKQFATPSITPFQEERNKLLEERIKLQEGKADVDKDYKKMLQEKIMSDIGLTGKKGENIEEETRGIPKRIELLSEREERMKVSDEAKKYEAAEKELTKFRKLENDRRKELTEQISTFKEKRAKAFMPPPTKEEIDAEIKGFNAIWPTTVFPKSTYGIPVTSTQEGGTEAGTGVPGSTGIPLIK